MINNKPNTRTQILFLAIIFVGFLGCNNLEYFTFEKQRFDSSLLENCVQSDCASIEINLIQSLENTPIAIAFNKAIENEACSILNVGENEPEKTLEDAIKEFNYSFQEISNAFPDEITPYEATIDCEVSFQNDTMISLLMDSYVFTGGAHGYGSISFINFSTKTGKRINNQQLFKNETNFLKYAEKEFRNQNNIPESSSINSTGFFFENDTFSLPSSIGFTDAEVILYYNPYEISSYAEGPVELKFKKEEVAEYFAIDIL